MTNLLHNTNNTKKLMMAPEKFLWLYFCYFALSPAASFSVELNNVFRRHFFSKAVIGGKHTIYAAHNDWFSVSRFGYVMTLCWAMDYVTTSMERFNSYCIQYAYEKTGMGLRRTELWLQKEFCNVLRLCFVPCLSCCCCYSVEAAEDNNADDALITRTRSSYKWKAFLWCVGSM